MHDGRMAVRLLGGVAVSVGRRPVRLAGRHAQALFALLVLRDRPRPREAIAADLWPEADSSSSGSLRQALWLVRSGFAAANVDPETILDIDAETVGLRPAIRIDLDVSAFERHLRDGGDPEAAVALYRGELVEGITLECFARERERLADCYEDALALLAERRLAAGDVDGGRSAAERLLARDPLREEAHAVLMAAYAVTGTRSQVVRQYRHLRAILRDELAVDPLPETELAYRRALELAVGNSRRRAAARAFANLVYDPTVATAN